MPIFTSCNKVQREGTVLISFCSIVVLELKGGKRGYAGNFFYRTVQVQVGRREVLRPNLKETGLLKLDRWRSLKATTPFKPSNNNALLKGVAGECAFKGGVEKSKRNKPGRIFKQVPKGVSKVLPGFDNRRCIKQKCFSSPWDIHRYETVIKACIHTSTCFNIDMLFKYFTPY